MPFQSEAQRRFLWAKHPEVAKEWAEHTPKGTKLPYHKKRRKIAAEATAPAKSTWLDVLLPILLGGGIGAGYGAIASPGKSMSRGALIGGLGGLSAGGAFSGINSFLDSGQSRHLQNIKAPLVLGSTALGLGVGLHSGRHLANKLHMGNRRDSYDNDLSEIDPVQQGGRMLPGALKEYAGVHKLAAIGNHALDGKITLTSPKPIKVQQSWTLIRTANKSHISNSNRRPLTMKELSEKPRDTALDFFDDKAFARKQAYFACVLPGIFG